MPNECANEVSVYGSVAELKRFKEAITSKKDDGFEYQIFRNLLPVDFGTSDNPRQLAIDVWGSKWGDYDTDVSDIVQEHGWEVSSILMEYLSAWSPCDYTKISEMFPDLTFLMVYSEHGWGFMGVTVYQKGEEVFSDFADSTDERYPQLREELPDEYEWQAQDEFDEAEMELRHQFDIEALKFVGLLT